MQKQVSPTIEALLIEISIDKEVKFNQNQAFDYLFQKLDRGEVNFNEAIRGLRQGGIRVKDEDVLNLIAYFSIDISITSFNKIQFVAGIKPWVEKKRPVNQHGFYQISQFQNSQQFQPGFNQGQQLSPQIDWASNCTKAQRTPGLRPPTGFQKYENDYQISEIIKGCFLFGIRVFDHFQRFGTNDSLNKSQFGSAISSLNCDWPNQNNDEIFLNFDLALNGHIIGMISPQDIDSLVHFSSTKNLQQMVDQILLVSEERLTRGSNLLQEFQKLSNQQSLCSFQDFKVAIEICGIKLLENDIKLLAKRYSYTQTFDNINYSQFTQDLHSAIKFKQNAVGVKDDFSVKLADAITKRMFIQKTNLTEFLTQQYPSRPLYKQDFIDSIGRKLELSPQICTDRSLSEIFQQISNSVAQIFDITKFFESKSAKTALELKVQILKDLFDKKCQTIFNRNEKFLRTNQIPSNDFYEILQSKECDLTKLDAQFIASYYITQNNEINVKAFLDEVNRPLDVKSNVVKQEKKIQMNVQQKKQLEQMQNALRKDKLELKLAQNFKRETIGDTGMISFISLQNALGETLNTKLTEAQVKDLVVTLQKDKYGSYNYFTLLTLLFGEHDANEIINGYDVHVPKNQRIEQQETKVQQVQKVIAPKVRILSTQELRFCQDTVMKIRDDLQNRNLEAGKFIEQNRANSSDTTFSPAQFKKFLQLACSKELFAKISDTKTLSTMVYYLIREENGRLSFAKLYQALALRDSEPPLRQEKIEGQLKYEHDLKLQLVHTEVPMSIKEIHEFMVRNDMNLEQFLGSSVQNDMSIFEFEKALQTAGYTPQDKVELIRSLQDEKTGNNRVSIKILQTNIRKEQELKIDPRKTKEKYGNMDEGIRKKIAQISDYLIRNGITIEQFHQNLDINKDGKVDLQEFADGVANVIRSGTITRLDSEAIFKAIDSNNDKFLSVNEFGLYLKGASLKRENKISNLDESLKKSINDEIKQLFQFFGKAQITAVDLHKAMQAVSPITMQEAVAMVKKLDANGDGSIDESEFTSLMEPILIDQFLIPAKEIEDLRAMFKDADLDYSGFLTIDEFYQCLLKLGGGVTREEVISLFSEFDIDGNMQLDIDEFVLLMTQGQEINFANEENKETYLKISKSRKLDKLDFLKAFKEMPASFVPSFIKERYLQKKNLPSCVFKVQIDPRTLLWKDMMQIVPSELTAEQSKQENQPKLRPIKSSFGSQITIEGAEGVPLPEQVEDRKNIMKRVVRVALYDTVKKDLIYNTTHVVAQWTEKQEDIWTFNSNLSLNPILFRTTDQDDLNRQEVFLIFELVVYLKKDDKTREMCCGWAQTPLETCSRDTSKIKLKIQGGTPFVQLEIGKDDVHTKRTGFKGFAKMFNNNIDSCIIISLKPLANLETETRLHLEMLPSTCLLMKKILYILSGFRNYAAEKLISQAQVGILKKPSGNVILSCFPKFYDCPDVLEIVAQIWQEDYFANIKNKNSVQEAINKMEEIVKRLYPVIYSDGFGYSQQNATESLCGHPAQFQTRKQLVIAALRQGTVKQTVKPENLTNFKPFNIKELQYEIWDDSEQKMEQIVKHYNSIGILSNIKPKLTQVNKIPIPEVK